MSNPCAFCDILRGQSPATVVFEDEHTIAFLDSRPLFPGHVLLIPKPHITTLPDLPPERIPELFTNVQLMSKAVPLAMDAEGSFVAMNNKVSQSVPHLHVHIVPRNRKDGLKGFFWPRKGYDDADHARRTGEQIAQVIEHLQNLEPSA